MIRRHLVTPFSRVHLLPALLEILRPLDVTWHLICSPDLKSPEPWVKIWPYHQPPGFDICYEKMNFFLQNCDLSERSDWLSFLCDDDALPLNFYQKLDLDSVPEDTDVVVSSLHYRKDGTYVHLTAAPENLKVGKIGLPQLFFRGSVLRNIRYREDHHFADGFMAEHVASKYKICFRPAAVVSWNQLNPAFGKV